MFLYKLFVPISSEMWTETNTSKQYSITLIILKQEGKGQTKSFWKNDTAQVYNIGWLESNESKMEDKSTLTRTWPSVSKLNDTSRGSMAVPKQYQKTKNWAEAQLLEISIPSPKYLD